ncbi:hypothetical protein K438DRAFT_1776457 [Mycena galopus ATCC 62051]|nr:hypothetical protein K438DRAFT_1776457 [Mycena galopus ATCC 62051]
MSPRSSAPLAAPGVPPASPPALSSCFQNTTDTEQAHNASAQPQRASLDPVIDSSRRADSAYASAPATSITACRANSAPVSVAITVALAPSYPALPEAHGSPSKRPRRVAAISFPLSRCDSSSMCVDHNPIPAGVLPTTPFCSHLGTSPSESPFMPAVASAIPTNGSTRRHPWYTGRFVSHDCASAHRRRWVGAAGIQPQHSFAGRNPIHEPVHEDGKDPPWRINAHPENAGRWHGYTAFRTSSSARSALVIPS